MTDSPNSNLALKGGDLADELERLFEPNHHRPGFFVYNVDEVSEFVAVNRHAIINALRSTPRVPLDQGRNDALEEAARFLEAETGTEANAVTIVLQVAANNVRRLKSLPEQQKQQGETR